MAWARSTVARFAIARGRTLVATPWDCLVATEMLWPMTVVAKQVCLPFGPDISNSSSGIRMFCRPGWSVGPLARCRYVPSCRSTVPRGPSDMMIDNATPLVLQSVVCKPNGRGSAIAKFVQDYISAILEGISQVHRMEAAWSINIEVLHERKLVVWLWIRPRFVGYCYDPLR